MRSLNLSGSGVSWTSNAGTSLTVNSIIKSGGGSQSTISGGNLLTAQPDLVIRTDTSSDSLAISSNLIQGVGALTKSGAGTLTLSGNNTYTGQTFVNGGTLSIGANVNLGAEATGATLNLRGGTLQATGNVTLDNSGANKRLVVLTNASGIDVTGSNTLTVAGVVSGAGSLTKTNSGTLALTGTNTYTGTTTVSAGTLLINGNNSGATGAFNVASGATLGGNGTIGGATTVSGNLQPGNSPGLLTFSSSLTLTGTSATTMEINGNTVRGTDYDGINISGALAYGGNLTLAFGTTFTTGNYTFDLFQISGGQSGSFATGGVTLTGNYTGTLVNNGSGVWGLTSGVNTWTFTQSSGDLGLSVVPEPATWALLAASLTTVMVLRRRRKA
jgi:autotransporter-associated beta strand protein